MLKQEGTLICVHGVHVLLGKNNHSLTPVNVTIIYILICYSESTAHVL